MTTTLLQNLPIDRSLETRQSRSAIAAAWLLIGLVALFAAGKVLRSDTFDADLFWHLKVADQLQHDGISPIVDRMSYESLKAPWTPYSWLAELGMKWVWDNLGWRGAVAGDALLGGMIVLFIGACCLTAAGPKRRLAAVIATIFGAAFIIPYIAFRPITKAILILAIIAWLLLRDRREALHNKSHAVWLILPLTALLINVHLCAILAPIWVGCLFLGALWERRARLQYALLLAGTMMACLMTPMLRGVVRTAWFYQWHDVMVSSGLILEMVPIYRNGVGGMVLTSLLAILVLLAILKRRKLRAGEWIWLLVAIAMMLRLAKFTPMFALIGAPVLAMVMPAPLDLVLKRPIIFGALSAAILVCLVRVALLFPPASMPMNQWLNRHVPEQQGYPAAGADYVAAQFPAGGRIINEFNWGGYLAWRMGDHFQVFVDGRTQLYSSDFWRATYLGNEDDLVRALKSAHADLAILPARFSRFRQTMINRMHWHSIYRDNVAEVLVP